MTYNKNSVKTTLQIVGGGNDSSFSNTKQYTEETATKFYVNAADGFTDLIAFSPDDDSPTKTATATGAPKAFCIYNSGKTALEIQFQSAGWAADNSQATNTMFLSTILGAGEMFFSNNMRLIEYADGTSGAMGTSTSLATATSKVVVFDATHSKGAAISGMITDTEDAADATTIVLDAGGNKLREGDYLFFDTSTSDAMKVVSVTSDTSIEVERGVLGYTAQVIPNDTQVYAYAGNLLHDKGTEDDSGTNIRTDGLGRFKGQLLGASGAYPRGTGATNVAGGIVPGSVSIQFAEHGAYQNLGISISPSDSTGLAVSTEYKFNLTTSLGATTNIAFTTDSSDISWAKVVTLINQSFVDSNYDYKVEIINGDVRFSHKKILSRDTLVVADPSAGTEPWNVGNVPDTAAHETGIVTKFPNATITDVQSGKRTKNTKSMLIDDGNGNLIGDVGSGTIDYDTGIIDITGPYRSEFKTSFAFGSAHSGIPTRASNLENMVSIVAGRSMNPLQNGEITIICYS